MTLLIDEPHAGGHQAVFLTHLIDGWARHGAPGTLVVSAPSGVLSELLASGAVLAERPPIPASGVRGALRLGRAQPLHLLTEAHRPDHVLAMSFEHMAGVWARRRRLPGRPAMSALAFHSGAEPPRTVRQRARDAALGAALRHPDLAVVHTLDPLAAPRLVQLGARRVAVVPDPVPAPLSVPPADAVRRAWGVEPDRRMAVLTGTLDGRKGAAVLLEALLVLPADAARRLAVVLAGRVDASLRGRVDAGLTRVRAETRVQVVHREGFVSDADLAALTTAADVVLLPYPAQVGSSGFLMRAAAAGTPVIAPASGLMGALTRDHHLGQAVDTRSATAVARALARAVAQPGAGFRPASASALARAHSPERFADALLGPILPGVSP